MSTILTTIRWLSIFTGALSLFYLGNAWFEFGLGEVFTRIYTWYAGILHPVVELLEPLALWLVRLFGWTLPVWWKDAAVFVVAWLGALVRGSLSANRAISEQRTQGMSDPQLYGGLALFEFVKILAGALIFAGLNAGLG